MWSWLVSLPLLSSAHLPASGTRRDNLALTNRITIERVSAGRWTRMSRVSGVKAFALMSEQVINFKLTGRHRLASGDTAPQAGTQIGIGANTGSRLKIARRADDHGCHPGTSGLSRITSTWLIALQPSNGSRSAMARWRNSGRANGGVRIVDRHSMISITDHPRTFTSMTRNCSKVRIVSLSVSTLPFRPDCRNHSPSVVVQ